MRNLIVSSSLLGVALLALRAAAHDSGDSGSLPVGHLVLLVEGDARGLGVTAIAAKPDPLGVVGPVTGTEIVVRDAKGRELGAYPLDLGHFDLDPTQVGREVVVHGCEVKERRVSVLASVPRFAAAASLEFRSGEQRLGLVDAEAFQRLLANGGGR